MKRKRKDYPLDGKTMFGLSTMQFANVAGLSFMTSLFMLYLTDYAGIGALGATLGTILLFVGRFVDAIDDPIQGFIMDNTKPTKWGKYRFYVLLSIILTSISIICLFALPTSFSTKPVLVIIWVTGFYLLYDIGSSFFADNPLKQTLSNDPIVRSKHQTLPRIVSTFVSVPFAFFLPMVTLLNSRVGDMHMSFAMLTVIMMVPITIISIVGTLMVKEGDHIENENAEKVTLKDVLYLFKNNKALTVNFIATIFNGFIWTFIFATATYYIKWAYTADLTTGAIDLSKLGLYTGIMGAMMMIPSLLGAMVAPAIMKRLGGDPIKTTQLSLLGGVVSGVLIFLLNAVGILSKMPVLFFFGLFISLFFTSLNFVPSNVVWLECGDYNIYKTGKEMNGMVNAANKFLQKAQTALASGVVGLILIAIGYQVDSVTDTFTGSLDAIPEMLNWFIVVLGLLPATVALISFLIYKYAYPITPQVRLEMNVELQRRRDLSKVKI